jgi:hypothetical protein
MDKIARGVMVNKPLINLKPFVTLIFCIVDMPWRGMCHNNIHSFLPPNLSPKASDGFSHLAFRILMRTPAIPEGSFKSQDIDPLEMGKLGMQINAPIR